MAGFSKMFVFGEPGGFIGTDGVNKVKFIIFVGVADRQWLEPYYFDSSIKPIGKIKSIVPISPNHPDMLIDSCIAFAPIYFNSCPSLSQIVTSLTDAERLDFHLQNEVIPEKWNQLRDEARDSFSKLNIWRADLVFMSKQ